MRASLGHEPIGHLLIHDAKDVAAARPWIGGGEDRVRGEGLGNLAGTRLWGLGMPCQWLGLCPVSAGFGVGAWCADICLEKIPHLGAQ